MSSTPITLPAGLVAGSPSKQQAAAEPSTPQQDQGQQSVTTSVKNEQPVSVDQVPLSNGTPASLYRAPTWARNINFDNGFDAQLNGNGQEAQHAGLSTRHTPNGSIGSSNAMAMMGVALSGGAEPGATSQDQLPARMGTTTDTREGDFVTPRHVSGSSLGSRGPAPSGMLLSHQRVASSHTIESATANTSARINRYNEPPRSSADLYAMPPQGSQQQAHHPSGALNPHAFDGAHQRFPSAPGTSEGAEVDPNVVKRGSVLSFQTAMSGGNVGGYSSNASNNGEDNSIERLNDGPPVKPWMQHSEPGLRSGPHSLSSSPDERNVPGSWGANRGMDDLTNSPRGKSPMQIGLRRGQASPRMQLLPLGNSSNEQMPSSPSMMPTQPAVPATPSQQARGQRETSAASSPGRMSPNTEKSLPSKPSTSRSSSRSRILTRPTEPDSTPATSKALPSLMSPSDSATILPAHEPVSPDGAAVPNTPPKEKNISNASGSPTMQTGPVPPAKDRELGVSSPPLSDDITPAPLPVHDQMGKSNITSSVINVPTSPISDFRAKPLAQLPPTSIPHDAASSYREMANGKRSPTATRKLVPGVGAHAASNSIGDSAPAFAALMRNNSAGNALASVPSGNVVENSGDTLLDNEDSPSAETPPREPSPPPEGEVEARAEWERQQMRRMVEKSKQNAPTSRKTTFRGQLKPLQLVAADEARQVPLPTSPRAGESSPKDTRRDATVSPSGSRSGLDMEGVPGKTVQTRKSGVLSTQQLQKQSARDQRRTASSLAMGVSEIGGAYPVFATPPLDPLFVGGTRQYRGVLPQRSLVPPFELQNRPDGLPSALIGPDGVRRNLNDPDICLECMMRDEDMIDVHVVGAGLWERESDRDFEEACKIEAERDAAGVRPEGSVSTHGGTMENSSSIVDGQSRSEVNSLHPARLTKIRVKRVAKGEPLSAERLKLHTQMNPPASSHRWRTLQVYLASQAKYIANEQRARGLLAQQPPVPVKAEQDPRMTRVPSGDSRKSFLAYPSMSRTDEKALPTADRPVKEREAGPRDPRRRTGSQQGQGGESNSPVSSAPRSRAPSTMFDMPIAEDVEEIDGVLLPPSRMLGNNNSTGHQSIPRRNNGPASGFARGGSAHDLRNVPNAMVKSPTEGQTSPNHAFPPSSSLRAPTPTVFGRSSRAASSQLSLAPSGSMIDMHVGAEDRREHRIAQAGFMPGSHINARSPSAFNRAYYGFPGDGEGDLSRDEGYADPMDQSYLTMGNDMSATESYVEVGEGEKRKKKASSGIRGLFGKLAGKDASSPVGEKKPSLDSKTDRPMSPESERPRRTSMGLDRLMDMQRPPPISGLLSKARRSTSSLLQGGMPSGRPSMDAGAMLNGDRMGAGGVYTNPPGMTSQASFEMGPFGFGPLPPPRGDSKGRGEADEPTGRTSFSIGRPSLTLRPESALRQRAISATNLFRSSEKSAVGDASDLPVSSKVDVPPSPIYERNRKASPAVPRDLAGLQNAYGTPRQPAQPYETPPQASMSAPRTSMSAARTLDYDQGIPRSESVRSSGNDLARGNDAGYNRPMQSPYRSPSNARTLDAVADVENEASFGGLPPSSSRKSFLPSGRLSMQGFRNDAPQHPLAKNGNRHDSAFLRNAVDDSLAPSESFASTRSSAVGGPTTPTTPSTASRKSRFLKLAFGRNKRESTAPTSSANAKQYANGGSTDLPTLNNNSARGTMDDSFNSLPSHLRGPRRQSSYSQLSMPQSSGLRSFASRDVLSPMPLSGGGINESDEFGRQSPIQQRPQQSEHLESATPPPKPWYMPGRRTSNQIEDRAAILGALPPRSRSALGMMDSSSFGMQSQDEFGRFGDASHAKEGSNSSTKGRRGLLPRFRTSSRAALRAVDED